MSDHPTDRPPPPLLPFDDDGSQVVDISGATILIVDDDEGVREALGGLLCDAGYDVTLAADGLEGLDFALRADKPFDLILLDIMMPVLDGIGMLQALDRTQRGGTPVLVISAVRRADEIVFNKDRYVFVEKPFRHPAVVLDHVQRAIKKGRSRGQ